MNVLDKIIKQHAELCATALMAKPLNFYKKYNFNFLIMLIIVATERELNTIDIQNVTIFFKNRKPFKDHRTNSLVWNGKDDKWWDNISSTASKGSDSRLRKSIGNYLYNCFGEMSRRSVSIIDNIPYITKESIESIEADATEKLVDSKIVKGFLNLHDSKEVTIHLLPIKKVEGIEPIKGGMKIFRSNGFYIFCSNTLEDIIQQLNQ